MTPGSCHSPPCTAFRPARLVRFAVLLKRLCRRRLSPAVPQVPRNRRTFATCAGMRATLSPGIFEGLRGTKWIFSIR